MSSLNHTFYASWRHRHAEPVSLAPPILPCLNKPIPGDPTLLLWVQARFQHAKHTKYDFIIVNSAYPAEVHVDGVTVGFLVGNVSVEA